eukprot:scaffold36743_cov65-Phaeocystis_antarctica.AAC.3
MLGLGLVLPAVHCNPGAEAENKSSSYHSLWRPKRCVAVMKKDKQAGADQKCNPDDVEWHHYPEHLGPVRDRMLGVSKPASERVDWRLSGRPRGVGIEVLLRVVAAGPVSRKKRGAGVECERQHPVGLVAGQLRGTVRVAVRVGGFRTVSVLAAEF